MMDCIQGEDEMWKNNSSVNCSVHPGEEGGETVRARVNKVWSVERRVWRR